jgi:hypothetical protein
VQQTGFSQEQLARARQQAAATTYPPAPRAPAPPASLTPRLGIQSIRNAPAEVRARAAQQTEPRAPQPPNPYDTPEGRAWLEQFSRERGRPHLEGIWREHFPTGRQDYLPFPSMTYPAVREPPPPIHPETVTPHSPWPYRTLTEGYTTPPYSLEQDLEILRQAYRRAHPEEYVNPPLPSGDWLRPIPPAAVEANPPWYRKRDWEELIGGPWLTDAEYATLEQFGSTFPMPAWAASMPQAPLNEGLYQPGVYQGYTGLYPKGMEIPEWIRKILEDQPYYLPGESPPYRFATGG